GIGGGVQDDAVDNPRFIVRAGPEAPLPVELTTFEGQSDGTDAVLSWTTASETNNAGFNVQRQTDNGTYETLTFVEGAGTTDTPQSYQTRVDDLSYGAHTFRVEQVDTDGTATPSEPVEVQVRLQDDMALTPVAPNPVRGQGTVELTVRETQAVTATVYDALGRRVRTLHDGEIAGQRPQTLTIDTATLASGTYFLRVQGEDATQTTRFVVVR
ncbi:MAG: T9SS type A sorting domain-containing protein, partial [Longimonas sp.]|uniref:T9SS type A sorting domain-containing protein n=1 Tax=Longimonas sp. TaxID=2039626 RepID=UPI0039752E8D